MIDKSKFRQAVNQYVKDVVRIYSSGDHSEKTFRTPLENFLNAIKPSEEYEIKQEVTSSSDIGIPDYTVTHQGSFKTIGFIETKNIGANLDSIINSEQISRYRSATNNILLTDYKRFILLQDELDRSMDCPLFTLDPLSKSKPKPNLKEIDILEELFNVFFSYNAPLIESPEVLSKELATKAKLVKWYALQELESKHPCNAIKNYELDLKSLMPDADNEQTADAYAQTITYGLFLAKLHAGSDALQLNTAFAHIPGNEGVIQAIFKNASTSKISEELRWAVQCVVDVLNNTDIDKVRSHMNTSSVQDPILYLYEDFLDSYNPEEKKSRGVFYTPLEIADFIVRNTNKILKEQFNKRLGLGNSDVEILDPAVGTGTFLLKAFEQALTTLANAGLTAIISDTIKNHLLKHFYGFEILVTPYVIAHLKLIDYLERKWNYQLASDDRIQVFLTNALAGENQLNMFASAEVAEENEYANAVKESTDIIAIMGNPPYKGASENNNPWINNLVKKSQMNKAGTFASQGYAELNGNKIGEKNLKWLFDDYVKFIRLAQCMIDNNPQGGVVAFITNHGYLDNTDFKWMRLSLMKSFNRIYIINLHGNVRKKEKAPDGRHDENVFNIQVGTAIGIFVKNPAVDKTEVFYTDLWGPRPYKLQWLSTHSLDNIDWQQLNPTDPNYYFVPVDTTGIQEYENFPSIKDIFILSSTGIKTSHDSLVIDFDKDQLVKRIIAFRDSTLSNEELASEFGITLKEWWDIKEARVRLKAMDDQQINNCIRPILYRPFDERWIFYDESVVVGMRTKVMKHLQEDNVGIIVSRDSRPDPWRDALVTDKLIEHGIIAMRSSGSAYIYPLFLYTDSGKQYNFQPEFIKALQSKYGDEVTLEDLFYYIYAVLYSPTYRTKYEEFLMRDYPRIPLIDDVEVVRDLSKLGKELADLHLMRNGQFWVNLPDHATFDVTGSNQVKKVRYEIGKVWINDTQYFDNVPEECWNFYIGNYRVLEKWLKSRKQRQLSAEEITTFIDIVEIIKQTLALQSQIDSILASCL